MRKIIIEIIVFLLCILCLSFVDILEIEILVIKFVLLVCFMVMFKRVDFNLVMWYMYVVVWDVVFEFIDGFFEFIDDVYCLDDVIVM